MKKALITGISGQDGSYLTEQLISKGYQILGTSRNVKAIKKTICKTTTNIILK